MSELVKFLTGHDEPFFQWREDALKPASSAFEPKKPAFNLLKGPKLSYSVPQGGRPSRRFYCVESDRYSMPTSERVAALFDHFERFTWAHSPFPHHHIGPRLSNEAQLEAAWQVFYTGRLKNVVKHLSTVEDSDPKPRFMMCQVPMRIPNEGATGDDYRLDISIGVDFDDPLATVSGVDCSIEFKTDAVLNDAILDALDLFHDHNGQAWAYKSTTSKAGGTLSAPKLKVHFSSWPKDMDAGLKDLVEQGIAHVVDSATMSHALGHHREFRSNGNRFFSAGCDFERHRVVYSRSAGYRKTGETVKAPRDSFPLISQLLADALDSISAKGRRTGDEKAASQQLLQSATTDVDATDESDPEPLGSVFDLEQQDLEAATPLGKAPTSTPHHPHKPRPKWDSPTPFNMLSYAPLSRVQAKKTVQSPPGSSSGSYEDLPPWSPSQDICSSSSEANESPREPRPSHSGLPVPLLGPASLADAPPLRVSARLSNRASAQAASQADASTPRAGPPSSGLLPESSKRMRLGESTATNPVPEAQGESTQPGESEEESEDQNEGDKTPTKNRH